jgi:hypothetical protein
VLNKLDKDMKSSIIFRKRYTVFLLALACAFNACKKDETFDFNGDATSRVYFNIGSYTVKNYDSFNFLVKHTPIGSIGDEIKAVVKVRATLETTESTKVSYSVDNSLVEAYNTARGTNYVAVPTGILELSTTQLNIPQGGLISADSLTVSVPQAKMALLTAPGYVVPIKINSVNEAKNVAVSTNANTVYVVIKTVQTNLYDAPTATDVVGTLNTVRTGWTATLDATLTSGSLPNMFDAGTNTSWYINPPKNVNLVVNMNAAITGIKGIRFHTSTTTYYLTTANVSTSMDGITWTSQGVANFSIVNAYQYVKFYSPVNARYIKLEITGWRSGSTRIMFTDFNIYI